MKTKRFAVLLAALLLFGSAVAGFAAGKPKGLEVTYTFRDADTDRIQSWCQSQTNPCPYSASIDIGADKDAPQIISGGIFYFNFTDQADCPTDGCRNPFGPSGVDGRVNTSFSLSECSAYPLHAMVQSQAQVCAFKPNPADPEADERWRLRFDSTPFIDGSEPEEGIGTKVSVTCTTNGADNKCAVWSIEAAAGNPNSQPPTGDTDIGFLMSLPARGRSTETWAGSYSMPFQITVTKQ